MAEEVKKRKKYKPRESTNVPNMRYEFEGEWYTLNGLCNKLGLKYLPVWTRLKNGMTINEAIEDVIHDPKKYQGIDSRW